MGMVALKMIGLLVGIETGIVGFFAVGVVTLLLARRTARAAVSQLEHMRGGWNQPGDETFALRCLTWVFWLVGTMYVLFGLVEIVVALK